MAEATHNRITIYLDGAGSRWIARAYDDDTEEYIWSSEGATSPKQALAEVAEGIARRGERVAA